MVNASPDSKADFSVVHGCAEAAERGAELLAEGATVLNAGDALQSSEMVELAAERGVTVVLPFMLGHDFRSVRDVSGDPVTVMVEWFAQHIERLRQAGVTQQLLLDCGVGFGPHDMEWPDRAEYQRAIYSGLDELRRFDLPLYVPVPWLQTPDRLELLDLALSQKPDYVRAHRPAQVREHHAALTSGS